MSRKTITAVWVEWGQNALDDCNQVVNKMSLLQEALYAAFIEAIIPLFQNSTTRCH